MTVTTTGRPGKQLIPLWKACVFIIIWVLVLASAGMFLGNRFFWVDANTRQINNTVAHYRQLVDKEPNNAAYRVTLAYNLYLLQDYQGAINHLNTVTALNKNYFDAYLNLGYVYSAMGYWDEALEAFHECVEIAPTDFQGYLNLGIAYREVGMYNVSLDALEDALFLRPGSAEIIYHKALTAEREEDIDGAIAYVERALSFDPRYQDALALYEKLTP
jgi:tetratricopeptide (TPR) repeat protein